MLVATNREDLHKQLKRLVMEKRRGGENLSIGKAVDIFIEFGLASGLLDLSAAKREEISKLIGEDGLQALIESQR